jgi:cyclophilin family peptidyl-prolyl cis-trans isomerase
MEGFMAQVGMNGDPAVNSQWDKKKLRDDPVIQSNKPGFVTFATSGKDSRTTQFFINMGDNSQLDSQGFSPFGKVIEGQNVVTSFCNRYGEQPNQDRIRRTGNEYLEREFPQLDAIVRATVEA